MSSKAQKQKGWLLPDDINDIIGAEMVMFCGVIPNEEHAIAALEGAVHELTYWWNWEKTDGREAADVAIYMRQVLECFVIDCCQQMRSCISGMIAPLLNQQSRELLEKLEDLYATGGEASIAPNLVYDASPDDIKRDLVVCFMCGVFIDIICDGEIRRRQEGISNLYWTVNFFSDIALIVAPFLGPLAGIIALGVAIGAKAAAFAAALSALGDEVLLDEVARDKVACCMYNSLRGGTPAFSVFANSLSGCGFNIFQNAEFIRQTIAPLLDDVDVYISWLKTGDDIWPYVDQGLLDVCPCDDYEWIYVSDFVSGPENWGSAEDFNPGCLYRDAVYNAAGYWEWHVGLRNAFLVLHQMIAGTHISEITIDWELSGFNGGEGMVFNNYDPVFCVTNELVSAYQNWQQNGRSTHTLDVDYTFTDDDHYLGFNVDVDPSDANIKMYQIIIKGSGPNPFTGGGPVGP